MIIHMCRNFHTKEEERQEGEEGGVVCGYIRCGESRW